MKKKPALGEVVREGQKFAFTLQQLLLVCLLKEILEQELLSSVFERLEVRTVTCWDAPNTIRLEASARLRQLSSINLGDQATLPIFCARAGWRHHRGPKGGFGSSCNPKSVPDVVVQVTSALGDLGASSEADTEVVQPSAGGQEKSIPAVTAQPPGPLRYRQG